MRALVIVESSFGNTRAVAEAIAEGLASGAEVQVQDVDDGPAELPADIDLLVVGGPTQAFGLSRAGTRTSAVTGREPQAHSGSGLREWLERLRPARTGVAAAAFDTRINSPKVPGSAARAARRRLDRLEFDVVAPPESFFVTGREGPVAPGELDRARSWGRHLAAAEPQTDLTG
ncbi:MAG TPA: flavodoxin domain-containing protein [Cellulomonadaceae bacterium]|nr:flavodoxin domain-containing protein [Cellulomonadaceae bacterium]